MRINLDVSEDSSVEGQKFRAGYTIYQSDNSDLHIIPSQVATVQHSIDFSIRLVISWSRSFAYLFITGHFTFTATEYRIMKSTIGTFQGDIAIPAYKN